MTQVRSSSTFWAKEGTHENTSPDVSQRGLLAQPGSRRNPLLAHAMAEKRHHVVFLNFPGTGHMNPTLPLVAELRQREVEVTYFVDEPLRQVVEAAGASWRYMQDPMEMNAEQIAHYVPEGAPKEDYEFPVSAVAIAASILPCLLSELKTLQPPPTTIIYDPFLPQGLVAAKQLGIPCVGSVTLTGPGVVALPPFLIDGWESKDAVCRGRQEIRDRYEIDIFEHGSFLEFYSPDQNIVTTVDSLYMPPVTPTQLTRFGHFPFRCVGPLLRPSVKRISHAKAAATEPTRFPWDQLEATSASSKKVVLISMGTVATSAFWEKPFGPHAGKNGLQDTTGKEFLQFVIRRAYEAFGHDEHVFVILATGPHQDALEGLPEVPGNFLLQETVPQLELLPRCDAFVTHGGANSMHEALSFSVPLVVVPMFGDQPGNADAVAQRGAGFAFCNPLESLTAQALRSSIAQLLEGTNSFRATAEAISAEIRQSGGLPLAAELILETADLRSSKLGGA